MTRTNLVILGLFFSCLASSPVLSGEMEYTCTVRHIYSLQEDGSLLTSPPPHRPPDPSLPPHTESDLERQVKNNPFTISRVTGAIVGKKSSLDTSTARSTTVIHQGSEENSFEATADFGAFKSGTHPYQVIKVKEYIKGSQKPFVAMGVTEILTGICK